jgi:quinoprotein glucose dehydrogenase
MARNARPATLGIGQLGLAMALGSGLWAQSVTNVDPAPYTTWSDYGGSANSMQYSALAQVDRTNVSRLVPAWFFPVPGDPLRLVFNPIIVDGVMYVAGERTLIALDAATGAELWRNEGPISERGISNWESVDRQDRRLIFTGGGGIRQVDARTGQTITSFGDGGRAHSGGRAI